MAKQEWQYHSTYRGCLIEHRPEMQRRGWLVRYKTDTKTASMVHYTLEKCREHVDRLHKRYGDKIKLQ